MLQHAPLFREKLMGIQNICKRIFIPQWVEQCLEMGGTWQDGVSESSAVEILRMYVGYAAEKIQGIVKLTELSKNEIWRVQRWEEVTRAFSWAATFIDVKHLIKYLPLKRKRVKESIKKSLFDTQVNFFTFFERLCLVFHLAPLWILEWNAVNGIAV